MERRKYASRYVAAGLLPLPVGIVAAAPEADIGLCPCRSLVFGGETLAFRKHAS